MSTTVALENSELSSAKHPPALKILFFAELWERFSFYGLKALVILFMVKYLRVTDEIAISIFAAYVALVYATPLIGGYIADHVLGLRKAIIAGAIFITLGHFTLIFSQDILYFYLGLALVVCGTGFFKSNISSLVGQLYPPGDPRRDSGFTLFYVGINLGAFMSPLLCGYLGETYGWHYGFALAGVGMLAGLFVFLKGQGHLSNLGLPPNPDLLKKRVLFGLLNIEQVTYLSVLGFTLLFSYLLAHQEYMKTIMPVVGVLTMLYLLKVALKEPDYVRKRILTIFLLMLSQVCMIAMFYQVHSSLTLFTDRNVDRVVYDVATNTSWYTYLIPGTIPTTWFQSINPLFIMLLGPILAKFWIKLGKKGLDLYPPAKFAICILFVGLGFGVLVMATKSANSAGMTMMYWLVIVYFLHTLGELLMQPIGLSMVTKLSPKKMVGTMMGIWILSYSFGEYFAAMLAKLAAVPNAAHEINKTMALGIYGGVFYQIMIFAIITAGLTFLLVPILRPVFDRLGKEKSMPEDDMVSFDNKKLEESTT